MNYIGFLKEEDPNIFNSTTLHSMFLNYDNDVNVRERIIAYLTKGIYVTGTMNYIYDDEGKPIGGLSYHTDGQSIWPIYYLHYIKKYPNLYIDENLLKNAEANRYEISTLSKQELIIIEKDFYQHWIRKS